MLDTRCVRTLILAVLLLPACENEESEQIVDATPLPDVFLPPPPDFGHLDSATGCVPKEEICNGEDDDCDGLIDDEDEDLLAKLFDDVDNCGACNSPCVAPRAELICQAAECRIVACDPGFGDYNGELADGCETDCVITAGGQELCDDTDNDCDGQIDEGFDFENDLGNCGGCGVTCEADLNSEITCAEGACGSLGCSEGFVDLDGEAGCEYACAAREADREFCNGLDDDCDGAIDEAEGLVMPEDRCGDQGVCAPECEEGGCGAGEACREGVCVPAEGPPEVECAEDADCQAVHPGLACVTSVVLVDLERVEHRRCTERTHQALCDANGGFRCARPPNFQSGSEQGLCDGLDNDCDGRSDEDFAAQLFEADRVTPLACIVGNGQCIRTGEFQCDPTGVGVICSVDAGDPEFMDDGDCDGLDDDCDGFIDEDFEDAWVEVAGFEIYAYEASRPGANDERPGFDPVPDDNVLNYVDARACSRPGVMPWADVNREEADTACRAAGGRLCTADEWARACGGGAAELYPYGPRYQVDFCNGGERAEQDTLLACGALESCDRGGVFDLSGNLKEWTSERRGQLGVVRGGGYESNLEAGLTCGQQDDLKAPIFRHATIGFRCCR